MMNASMVILLLLMMTSLIFLLKPLRQFLISAPLLKLVKRLNLTPHISQTEREALEAGQVGPESGFFRGKLNFEEIDKIPFLTLTQEEQSFLDNEVEMVCNLTSDWQSWEDGNLAPEVWDYLKRKKFFGMIIPKEYGGLGFSHFAHSQVILKLSSRSVPLAVTTMVPNSLGPAELLLKYGTEEQKSFSLPRLAEGKAIPCFGLTEPEAGSDASSIISNGVVFRDGHSIKIKLNWKKRWITLGHVATLIGVAFRLMDPDHILGDQEDLGITCALIPSDLPGVDQSRRHDPLGVPFINSPMEGKDVVVRMSAIIGGEAQIGRGWMMLTECLSAGRGISLPSLTVGLSKMVTSQVVAHATLRKQFGISIGHFEGVKEPLVRIAGQTYLMDSVRQFTLGMMTQFGAVPVVSAIAKYQLTELSRVGINDAMDIFGGTGITRGPHNSVAHAFISSPIGITVEGANILTRTLIIFGQGVIRAHPDAYGLLKSVEDHSVSRFDHYLWSFVGHFIVNLFKSLWYSVTRGVFIRTEGPKETRRFNQKIIWATSRFSLWSSLILMLYGPELKKKEYLSGRYADILSWLFISLAVSKRYEAEGANRRDFPYVQWSLETSFQKAQRAFEEIANNINLPVLGFIFKVFIRKWIIFTSLGTAPQDQLVDEIGNRLLNSNRDREVLREGIYVPFLKDDPQATLERAYIEFNQSRGLNEEIKQARKSGLIPKDETIKDAYLYAEERGIIESDEAQELRFAEDLRQDAIAVDSFLAQTFTNHHSKMGTSNQSLH